MGNERVFFLVLYSIFAWIRICIDFAWIRICIDFAWIRIRIKIRCKILDLDPYKILRIRTAVSQLHQSELYQQKLAVRVSLL